MRKTFKLFSFLASFAFAGSLTPVLADTAAATPAAAAATATPTPVPTPVVTVDGLIDAYYAYNFSAPGVGINNAYWYNSAADSYSLGLAEAKLTATQGAASGHLVLAYGEEASLGLGAPGIDVLQAYVSYNPGQWTFNFGKFVTWMGYEVIESTGNWNYSHSLLFGALPYWHTGFSANFTPSATFNVTGYITDGNNTTGATSVGKTLGLEAVITPNAMWSITLNGIMSPFAYGLPPIPTVDPTESAFTGEGIVVFKPDSTWSFALDGQYGTYTVPTTTPATPTPGYFGVALYGKYQIQSDWDAVLRLEYIGDNNNSVLALYGNTDAAGKSFTGDEVTLTIEHDFTPNMIARLEGRMDMASYASSSADVFGSISSPSSSQVTGTASVAYTF